MHQCLRVNASAIIMVPPMTVSTLIAETGSSETSVHLHRTTRHHVPEYGPFLTDAFSKGLAGFSLDPRECQLQWNRFSCKIFHLHLPHPYAVSFIGLRTHVLTYVFKDRITAQEERFFRRHLFEKTNYSKKYMYKQSFSFLHNIIPHENNISIGQG